jgi:hypothetical protein
LFCVKCGLSFVAYYWRANILLTNQNSCMAEKKTNQRKVSKRANQPDDEQVVTPVATPATQPVILPIEIPENPILIPFINLPANVDDPAPRELTTAQKVSHFKKKLDGLLQLATELAVVDNRFRDIRNTLQKLVKLIDPGAVVKVAAEKAKRREELNTTPVPRKSVQRPVLGVTATEKKPVTRPKSAKGAAPAAPGGFNTTKPGPKIPFGGRKKKV